MFEEKLSGWIRAASLEDKYDVIMQLAVLASSDAPVVTDPCSVWVGDGCKVRIRESGSEPNLAWQPPEIIKAAMSGDANPLSSVGPAQRLYTVGLLSYFVLTGKDYYSEHGIDAANLCTYVKKRASVMRKDQLTPVAHIANALIKWTSVKPEIRAEGTALLIEYLNQHVPGTIRLVYVDNGTQVHTEDRDATQVVSLRDGDVVEARDGSYKVVGRYAFPYRPGVRTYMVKVERAQTTVPGKVIYIPKSFQTGRNSDSRELVSFIDLRGESAVESITLKMTYPDFVFSVIQFDANGHSSNLGSVRVPKPAGYGGSEYVLALLYDAENHMLYARLEDTAGHLLGGRYLGSI